MSNVVEEIKESQKAHYHRGKSWEHCYAFFRDHKKFNNDEKIDLAALHLGFFLASWGMLRGASFLLQKDYKFYISIVKILIKPKYNKLWDVNFLNESKDQVENIGSLFKLKNDLMDGIEENYQLDQLDKKEKHELDLIITKIIMATMGCVPAYDTYFKTGLKTKIDKVSFNEKSFSFFLKLIKDSKLTKIYKKEILTEKTNIKYPKMKLLDLHFWLIGYEIEKAKQNKKL